MYVYLKTQRHTVILVTFKIDPETYSKSYSTSLAVNPTSGAGYLSKTCDTILQLQ